MLVASQVKDEAKSNNASSRYRASTKESAESQMLQVPFMYVRYVRDRRGKDQDRLATLSQLGIPASWYHHPIIPCSLIRQTGGRKAGFADAELERGLLSSPNDGGSGLRRSRGLDPRHLWALTSSLAFPLPQARRIQSV